MKTLVILFFFHSIGLASPKNEIKLVRLKGNIYVVEDYNFSRENSVVYVGEKEVTIISATWTPETAKSLVEKIQEITNKPITSVINTNYHPDRAGGNSYFKKLGTKVLATKQTYNLMAQNWNAMVKSTQSSFSDYPALPLSLPDKIVENGYSLQNEKIKILYFGPSHTEDGVVVYFPEDKVLYGGCILKEQLGNLSSANLIEYPLTLKKLKQLDIKNIIAGHGSSIHGPELIDRYISLLEDYRKSSVK